MMTSVFSDQIRLGSIVPYRLRVSQLPAIPQRLWNGKIRDICMNATGTSGIALVENVEPGYEECTEHIFLSQIVSIHQFNT